MSRTVTAVTPQHVDCHTVVRIFAAVVRAPFVLLTALFKAAFRLGLFFLVYAPITVVGLLFGTCAVVVIAVIVNGIYHYNVDPVRQLHSKQVALAFGQQMDRENDAIRRKKGLPSLVAEHARNEAALEHQLAQLQDEIAAGRAAAVKHPDAVAAL